MGAYCITGSLILCRHLFAVSMQTPTVERKNGEGGLHAVVTWYLLCKIKETADGCSINKSWTVLTLVCTTGSHPNGLSQTSCNFWYFCGLQISHCILLMISLCNVSRHHYKSYSPTRYHWETVNNCLSFDKYRYTHCQVYKMWRKKNLYISLHKPSHNILIILKLIKSNEDSIILYILI